MESLGLLRRPGAVVALVLARAAALSFREAPGIPGHELQEAGDQPGFAVVDHDRRIPARPEAKIISSRHEAAPFCNHPTRAGTHGLDWRQPAFAKEGRRNP